MNITDIKTQVEKYVDIKDISDNDLIRFVSNAIRVITEDYTLLEYIERLEK